MENQNFILDYVYITIAVLIGITIVLVLFKKTTIMRFIGMAFASIILLIAYLAYSMGAFGTTVIYIGGPVGLLAVIACYYLIASRVQAPLQKLMKILNSFAEGDLNISIDEKAKLSSNEMGQMAVSVDNLIIQFKKIVKETVNTSQELLESGNSV